MMLAVLTLAVAAAGGPSDAPLSAGDAAVAALERAPAVAEAAAAVRRADGARRAECGLRNDPTVRGAAAVVGEAWSVSALQPLSLTGAGRAACSAARRAHEATRSRLERQRIEVAAEARRAWVDAVTAGAREDLTAHAFEVARGVAGAAGQRVEAGGASVLDLRLARRGVERAPAAGMGAVIEGGARMQARAGVTGVPVDALSLPADPLADAAAAEPPARGAGVRSDVAAAHAEAEAARAGVARARAGTLPPVSVGVFVEEEGDAFRAGPVLSLTLPLWRANADGRGAAAADLALAEARADAATRGADAEQVTAERTRAALDAALRDQPGDVPEQARAALDSVALGFDRGELDLLSVSLLQAEILDGHLAWIEGRRLVARARIDALLAAEDAALLRGAGPP